MKCPKATFPDTFATDQFGARNLQKIKTAQKLCVPAVKGVVTTTTTSTTSTTTTTVPLDPCNPNPCQNGGDCFDFGGGSFECFCNPEWTGPTCEQCGTPCSDRPDYYRDRFLSCMATDPRGQPYCTGWMGCVGDLYIDPAYGTITGPPGFCF
jgi:hypothetical protein